MKRLRIDFVSDVVCPWCAVGLWSLERALQRLAGEVEAEIHVRPFELNPEMAPGGEPVDEHLARKYGGPPEQFAAVRRTLAERGAAVGFTFGERTRIWNTFAAHRLLHWAGTQGRALDLKRALLLACHGEGRDIEDPAELARLAAGCGLDATRAAELLAGGEYAEEVRAEEARWLQAGIRSVPAVVVDGRHLISGGQPPEVFEQALRRIAAG
ncbi:MAG: DsbA family oxidoreductase [Comamonadaceae bacterium]|nr:DsbA family oxidoreductase [Comamonadaceae bacterium]